MEYEILSIETAELKAKEIKKQQKIEQALKYLKNAIENQDVFTKEDLLTALVETTYILKER